MNDRDERGPWYLITGLALGVLLGLAYAWAVQPVRYLDTSPSTLRQDFKDQYRALIAAAFLGNGDVVRARARLELLHDADMFRALTEQAQRTLAENGSDNQARALGVLAIALGKEPPGPAGAVTQAERGPTSGPTRPLPTAPIFDTPTPAGSPTPEPTGATPEPASPTAAESPTSPAPAELAPAELATEAPTATITSTPSELPLKATAAPSAAPATQAAISDAPFVLLSQEKLCDPPLDAPQFQIEALDRFNQPLAGALVVVAWPGGTERFFTGLKPEINPGYADFRPTPGVLYSVRIGENGVPLQNLAAAACSNSGGAPVWGAWLLKFVQP